MFRVFSTVDRYLRHSGLTFAAAGLLALAGIGGCADQNVRKDDPHAEDSPSAQVRRFRGPDTGTSPVGVSDKARQVERDFGVE
jgi:hypothetical protein